MRSIGKIVKSYLVYLARPEPLHRVVNLAENLQVRGPECRCGAELRRISTREVSGFGISWSDPRHLLNPL
jgi:hypothetical protein